MIKWGFNKFTSFLMITIWLKIKALLDSKALKSVKIDVFILVAFPIVLYKHLILQDDISQLAVMLFSLFLMLT